MDSDQVVVKPRLSRRTILAAAATVTAGAATAGAVGVAAASDTEKVSSTKDTVIIHVRDLAAGKLDVFVGEQRFEVRDKDLAKKLAKAARR